MLSIYFYTTELQQVKKSLSFFPRPMAYGAAPMSVSIALGHASANAVKVITWGWSTGSSASLTFPLHSHMSSARQEGSEYHLKVLGMTRPGLEPRPTGCEADGLPICHHYGCYNNNKQQTTSLFNMDEGYYNYLNLIKSCLHSANAF